VTVVVQLSDPHIGADWEGRDPAAALNAAIEQVIALDLRPAAVLMTGDVAEHGDSAEYELALELLAPLGEPLHVLPGNHDDRAELRRRFELPGAGAEPVRYAADAGPLRVALVDTTIPGADGGELSAAQLGWLEGELDAGAPTVIAMHHPPLWTGLPAADAMGLPAAERTALTGVVARRPNVLRIVAGHFHRTITGELGGRAVLVAPSTYMQGRFDLESTAIALAPEEPAGFAVHVLGDDGALASHVVTVDRTR
jgi:3',5'-cyclic-AMP phosphodiesterase